MKRPIAWLFLFLFVSGCGSALAPNDAVVTGPADGTFEAKGVKSLFFPGVDFQVRNKADVALPDVEIELIAASSTGNVVLADINGTALDPNPKNSQYLKTKTDDRGLVRANLLVGLPDCGSADLTVTASVSATVGVTNKLWTATITVKAC